MGDSRYEEICDKIIELLKADADIERLVKQFQLGPAVRYTLLPVIFVVWRGGPVDHGTADAEVYKHDYYVVVVHGGSDGPAVERIVMKLTGMVGSVIEANPTLGGLVGKAFVTNEVAERDIEGDRLLVGSRITVSTEKEET